MPNSRRISASSAPVVGVGEGVAAAAEVDQIEPVARDAGLVGPAAELGAGDLEVEQGDVAVDEADVERGPGTAPVIRARA